MKTNLNTLKLTGLALSVSFLAACGPKAGAPLEDNTQMASNIVGGTAMTAALQKQAGVVGLVIITEGGTGICTGSLIAKRLVLTAAHCLDESGGAIKRMFAVFAPNVMQATSEQIRAVDTGMPHELFAESAGSDSSSWNDIAIVRLAQDAPADFSLARLPLANTESTEKLGARTIEMGFGKAEAARNSTKDSSGVLRQVAGLKLLRKSTDGKELIIDETNRGSCNGDSGGPAFVRGADGKLTQIGIDSRGNSPTSCLEEGVYTSVSSHLAWIKEASAKLLAPKPAPTAPAPSAPAPEANH